MSNLPDNKYAPFEVGVGRANVFYAEADRRLRFNMSHSDGPGRGILHIIVDPMPQWYSGPECAMIGPVTAGDKNRVLHNILENLKERLYECRFEDRQGVQLDTDP